MISVMIVDDHALLRAGLCRILEQTADIDVVGVACNGVEAIRADGGLAPDVILMDISMPVMSGLEATRRICDGRQDANVVMLTGLSDSEHVLAAFDAGARGYLLKDADPAALITGIREAANGDVPLDARAGRALLEGRRAAAKPNLTAREMEVLGLVRNGLTNKAIANQLGISEKTVKAHLTKIFTALGVAGRTQAALWAHDNLTTRA